MSQYEVWKQIYEKNTFTDHKAIKVKETARRHIERIEKASCGNSYA
ncbi:hypothetical protein [Chengkuizengella marina]|nr:hypothetical protein [Chengkuizengella marina]